ncbi:MAG: hypothetical protein JNK15_25415, partial [Planctomycetes bacterium]|nr:hypothetical protein [Planctomycetota bacterium]
IDVLIRLATMQQQLGRMDEAETQARKALDLLATPAADSLAPALRDHLRRNALTIVATLHDRRNRNGEALAVIDAALAIPSADVADTALDERDLRLRIRLRTLRATQCATSDPAAALRDAEAAEALVDTLAQRHPRSAGLLSIRIGSGGDCANLLRLAGRPDDALAKTRALIELRRTHPQRDEWPSARATLHLVGILDSAERGQEVIDLCSELEPTLARFVADHPSIVVYRTAMIELHNHRANAWLGRKDMPRALAELRSMRAAATAALAVAPEEVALRRQAVIACTNIALVHHESRRLGRDADLDEMADALRHAKTVLDTMPTPEAQRAARPHRLEIHRLQSLVDEARGDSAAALASLRAAAAFADELRRESFGGAEFQNRSLELQRMFVGKLLDHGLVEEGRTAVDGALADSLSLRDQTLAKARWHSRHRELLLLAMRTHAALGAVDLAMEFLDEHHRMGPEPPGTPFDWIGRQECGTAVAKLLSSLAPDDPNRARWLARGRQALDEGIGFAAENERAGTGHAMVAVMSGNTWVIRRDLERAAGEWSAAARAASEAVEQYASAHAENPSDRSERRLVATAASGFHCLAQAGDAAGLGRSAARARELFAGRGLALADLATALLAAATPTVAEPARAEALATLQAARAAGATAAELAAPRFDGLRADPLLREHLR